MHRAVVPSSTTPADSFEPETSELSTLDGEESPFTPDGKGTVIDQATYVDGKEFYTIVTEDSNVFYLIIDHQKDTQNVYFLRTVTEEDLITLAEQSRDSSGHSNIPAPAPPSQPEPTSDPEPEPEPNKENSTRTVVFILFIAVASGGAGYYFKIAKPKQQAELDDDNE